MGGEQNPAIRAHSSFQEPIESVGRPRNTHGLLVAGPGPSFVKEGEGSHGDSSNPPRVPGETRVMRANLRSLYPWKHGQSGCQTAPDYRARKPRPTVGRLRKREGEELNQ